MFDKDNWQEIYFSLRKNKLRALLTAFGVSWGIFMLVILLGAGAGLENGATSNFDIAKNAVFVWTEQTSIPYKGMQPGRVIQLRNSDAEAIRQSIPEVGVIAPLLFLQGSFSIERGGRSASFSVQGGSPDGHAVKPLLLSQGRFINSTDLEQKRKVAVIGRRVKELLFDDGTDPIGQYIEIKDVPFLVVGVFDSRLRGEQAVEDLQTVQIPITALQQTFSRPGEIDYFAFIPREGVSAAVVEEKVAGLLAERHQVAPDDKRAIGTANVEREYRQVQTLFSGIRGFSWLVAIGTIIAGAVGVGNIMMIVVKERTKEFGIRKSLGATPGSIISMILMEALVLTSIAGYAGLAFGVLVVESVRFAIINMGLDNPFFYNPQIDFTTAISAIFVLVAAGLIAGLIPGLRAANVNPVIALREE
jgi:putative ABC transport system permease protein